MLMALLLGGGSLMAQDFVKMDKSPMDAAFYPAQAAMRQFAKTDEAKMALEPKIRVLYSRPYLNGRTIFRSTDDREDGITKYGESWRLGANESTELLLMQDAKIGDRMLKAGRYSIVVTPTADKWTFHINEENDGWGNYSHKPSMDLVTVSVPVTMADESLENLSIALYSPEKNNVVHLKTGWGNYRAELPIELM